MTNSDWIIIEAAFAEATSLEGEARANMLAKFASKYPNLEQQLLDLLAADTSDDAPLAEPIASSAKELTETALDPWDGRRVGVWTIKNRIADGGMGAVFLAERSDDEYQQQVALKIMTAQLLDKDAVIRFRAERQILASLSHPNIAKLIDGGSTDENLPYLVLELVDGLPIDRYCDEHRLSIAERLQLFQKVCAAVDYAHRNLVVHRDLKPNNILVDESGEPKLLDFGIAKLLESNAIGQTAAVTRQGMLMMTPEYASPEQVRGESPTVATDVYALGVLLYRILTGQSPYGGEVTSKHEMERAIVETMPRRPSTAVTDDDTSGRSISPTHLQKRLEGDLDNIVMMALQKEPIRRYATASVLADDIENYLVHRPVVARADSLTYRAGKFIRRNRLPLAVTGMFLATVISLSSFYGIRITEERDVAEQERAAAEQVTDFLVDIFSATEAGQPDAETVTIREVLDRGAEKIDGSMVDQPLVRARVLQHIGRTYASIARYDDALVKYRDALTIFEQETGASADTAYAWYRYANTFLSLRDWQTAHENYRVSLEMHRAQTAPDRKRIAEVLRLLVYTSQRLGNSKEAEGYLDEMTPLVESIYGSDDIQYANSLYSRATLLRALGRNEEAIGYAREALNIAIKADGENAPSTVNYRHTVGMIEWERGNYDEALAQYQQGIAIRSELLGPDHPSLFNILFSYGATLAKLERYDEAATSHSRLLETQREALGSDNFVVAYTEGAYGMVLLELDRVDEAEAAFVNANRIWELLYGPDYLESGVAIIGLGHVARERGDVTTARQYYERGVTLRENTRGQEHPATARAVASLADLEFAACNFALAKGYYQRALAVYEDPAHPIEAAATIVKEQIRQIDAESSAGACAAD